MFASSDSSSLSGGHISSSMVWLGDAHVSSRRLSRDASSAGLSFRYANNGLIARTRSLCYYLVLSGTSVSMTTISWWLNIFLDPVILHLVVRQEKETIAVTLQLLNMVEFVANNTSLMMKK